MQACMLPACKQAWQLRCTATNCLRKHPFVSIQTHRCVRAMGVCGVWMRYILLSVRCVSAWGREEGRTAAGSSVGK